MVIAVLGATGHIAKCTIWALSQNNDNIYYLFSRDANKLKTVERDIPGNRYVFCEGYDSFANYNYDVIVNGTGFWDMPGSNPSDMFELTERFDNMILDYQKKHKDTKAIHISSGAAYSTDYQSPVGKSTRTDLTINSIKVGDYYSIAKINSEAKHRAHTELSIVDLRLFGFFSRFMSLEYKYLLSALINSVNNDEKFTCIGDNFWRDYIHLSDYTHLIDAICEQQHINTAIDVRSKKPISRDEIIEIFKERYGLKVIATDNTENLSKTGTKPFYYSEMDNNLYNSVYTSRETLIEEMEYLIRR